MQDCINGIRSIDLGVNGLDQIRDKKFSLASFFSLLN